jgi:hypothetical protein
MIRLPRPRVLAAACLGLTLASCEDSPTNPTTGRLDELITSVASIDTRVSAELRGGELPSTRVGTAPAVSVVGAFINGGSVRIRITRGTAFSRAVVRVQGRSGYISVGLPEPRTTVTVTLAVSDSFPGGSVAVQGAVGTSAAELSPYAAATGRVITVRTGDIQVTASWDEENDLDLNVTDPSGATVSFAQDSVPSGGVLDLDSNAGCSIDNVNNENIVWPTGRAPRGQYIVRVNLWSNCGVSPLGATWRVTVRVVGQPTQTFTGRLTEVTPGSQGTEVTRITY